MAARSPAFARCVIFAKKLQSDFDRLAGWCRKVIDIPIQL